MNSKEQGDIGVAQAAYWYSLQGYKVSLPSTDATRYDLVVDKGDKLHRVQCKTTFTKSSYGVPIAELRTMGGNKSWSGLVKMIDEDETDLVWICVEGEDAYEIPVSVVSGMSSINLGTKYLKYAVMGEAARQRKQRDDNIELLKNIGAVMVTAFLVKKAIES